MTARLGRAALAALSLAFAAEADARELRYPAKGDPAIILQVPDDWTDKPDGDGNWLVVSADHTTSFVMSQGTSKGPLDDAAKAMLHMANATPPMNVEPTSVSGQAGFAIESTMKTAGGTPLQLKMIIVRLGERGYMLCTKFERETNSPEQHKLADAVLQSMKIVGAETMK